MHQIRTGRENAKSSGSLKVSFLKKWFAYSVDTKVPLLEEVMVKEPFQFDPIDLLDWTRWRLRLFSDFDLAKKLKTSPSAISKIRRGHQMMGAGILLRILDLTDVRLRELPGLIDRSRSHWKWSAYKNPYFQEIAAGLRLRVYSTLALKDV